MNQGIPPSFEICVGKHALGARYLSHDGYLGHQNYNPIFIFLSFSSHMQDYLPLYSTT